MIISARLNNSSGINKVELQTNEQIHSIDIPSKPSGFGSQANGGELLFLALAACYCNDIYREAAKRKIKVTKVEVEVKGEFGAEGEPAKNISYGAKVTADVIDKEEIEEMMRFVDKTAEIQNTLRTGAAVNLSRIEAHTVQEK